MNEERLKILIEKIKLIRFKYEHVLSGADSRFNLFSILRDDGDEVKLHSAFLGELLNPKGTHGMEDLYLQKFLDSLPDYKSLNLEFDNSKVKIEVEYHIGPVNSDTATGGRIDLLITDGNNQLAIENKIFAEDQHQQLKRYHNFLGTNNLLYLTLHKKEASVDSRAGIDSQPVLVENDDFYSINYKDFIIPWVEWCKMQAVDKPGLRESLQQYLNLLKKLTGTSLSKNYVMDIANELLKDKESLKMAESMAEAVVEAKSIVLSETIIALYNEASKYFKPIYVLRFESSNVNQIKEYATKFFTPSQNGKYIGISFPLKSDPSIHFRIEFDGHLFFGFVKFVEGAQLKFDADRDKSLLESIEKIEPNKFESSDYWIGWAYPKDKFDFNSFSSEEVYDLVHPENRKVLAKSMIEEASKIIAQLK